MTSNDALSALATYWWILPVLFLIIGYKLVLRLMGCILVPQNAIGIVDKRYVVTGKNKTLPEGQIVALNGEAGIQSDTLAPGLHFFLYPWQYKIRLQEFVVIPSDSVGIVESRAGKPIQRDDKGSRILGKRVDCDSFQDTRGFLMHGGERGPQIAIIPPGTYRINTSVFTVKSTKVLEIPIDGVGIVTVKDGRELRSGDIAGPPVEGHDNFQNGQGFIDAGGSKGLQEQVILAGRYFINPLFATVEIKPMTEVPIANVGVVISYVGDEGTDVTGVDFKHANIVGKGQKGVWIEPFDPGKYPINPFTHKVELVPTANVVLNWAEGKTEAHNLDKDLSTITVRSSDGFKFNLDVSQIIHIPHEAAPKVIARFGSMINLVTQVLEPTIGNYFRNAAQSSDVIDFLKNRQKRQEEAKASIAGALEQYDVTAVDTLIGDITPPEALMKTLTDRKIAEQEQVTYQTQSKSEEQRMELNKQRALADTQAEVVSADRSVTIAEFTAKAAIASAEGQAKSKTINAEADAKVTIVTGEADAGKVKAIGSAEADVIKLKIASMEAGNYATIETAKALAASGRSLVPEMVSSGGGGTSGSSLVDLLLMRTLQNEKPTTNGNSK